MSDEQSPTKDALFNIHADRRVFKVTLYFENKPNPYSNTYYVATRSDVEARKKVIEYISIVDSPSAIVFCTVEYVCTLVNEVTNE